MMSNFSNVRRGWPLGILSTALMGATGALQAQDIQIVAGEHVIHATLEDNVATQSFLAMLPLELELSDYHNTEKIAYLPDALDTQGMPKAMDPEVGDFTYFAPWGNIALFYKDFGHSPGLVKLGEIAAEDIETLRSLSKTTVVIRP